MHPYIQFLNKPLSPLTDYKNGINNIRPVFMVHVTEKELRLTFSVEWLDPKTNPVEFKVLKCHGLWLGGMDKDATYPPSNSGTISSDPSIAQILFRDSLEPYGITLHKVIVHSMTFYESQDFTFDDPLKKNDLYALINEQCKKIKHS